MRFITPAQMMIVYRGIDLAQWWKWFNALLGFSIPYEWPTYYIASKENLQALGVISLNFNLYENGLKGFLSHYMSYDLAELLFDKLNNEKRNKLIREMIASMEREHKVKEHIEFLISHFSTCSANRNILLHARVRGTPSEDFLPLEKNDKDEPRKILQLDLKLGDLRRTADEMRAGYEFMIGIFQFLIHRQSERNTDRSFSSPLLGFPLPSPKSSLPKKPPIPRSIDQLKL